MTTTDHQPREHAVPCSGCQRPTWRHEARCEECAVRALSGVIGGVPLCELADELAEVRAANRTADGTYACCGGFGEHWSWCVPTPLEQAIGSVLDADLGPFDDEGLVAS